MRSLLICALALAALGACAGEPPEPSGEAPEAVPEAVIDLDDRPSVEIPEDEPPPDELIVEELLAGDGQTVGADDVVTVHIIGVTWEAGQRVVSSWDRGAPRSFAVEMLIPGVREGITGMAVGARRRIVVPPELGYGDDAPAGIGPDDTLVFVVDLVSIG